MTKRLGVIDEFEHLGQIEVVKDQILHTFHNFGSSYDIYMEIQLNEVPQSPDPGESNSASFCQITINGFDFLRGYAGSYAETLDGSLTFVMNDTNAPGQEWRFREEFELKKLYRIRLRQMLNGHRHTRLFQINEKVILQQEFESPTKQEVHLKLARSWGNPKSFSEFGFVQNLRMTQYSNFQDKYINRRKREAQKVDQLDLLLNPQRQEERQRLIEGLETEVSAQFKQIDFNQSYESFMEVLWYSQMPCFDVQNLTSGFLDEMSILKRCYWKEQEIPCPLIFQTVSTDIGMCCAFNYEKAEEIYHESRFSQASSFLQNFDKQTSFYHETRLPDWFIDKNEPKSQAGLAKGLQLVLDAHTDRVSPGTVFENYDGFRVHVNKRTSFPLIKRQSFLVKPGQQTFVSLSAIDIKTDDDTKSISPERRQCFFQDEFHLQVFKQYSHESCFFECQTSYAKSQMNSSCNPWFYPGIHTSIYVSC